MRILYYSTAYKPQVDGLALHSAMFVQALRQQGHEVLLTSSRPDLDDEQGVSLPGINMSRYYQDQWMLNFFNPRTWRAVAKLFREFRPQVVHITMPDIILPLMHYFCRRNKVPLIATHHTDLLQFLHHHQRRYSAWWLKQIMRFFYHRCSATTHVTFTPSYAQKISQVTGLKHILVSPLCIDDHIFYHKKLSPSVRAECRQQLTGCISDKPIFLYCGRLAKEKNLTYLIDLFRELPTAYLVMVGDGPLALEDAMAYDHIIVKRGFLAQTELVNYYRCVDYVISASDFESQGMSIIEALACATPVVVKRTQAYCDYVQENKQGVFITQQNLDDDRAQLQRLIDNPLLQQQMRHYLRQQTDCYSLSQYTAFYLRLYQERCKA